MLYIITLYLNYDNHHIKMDLFIDIHLNIKKHHHIFIRIYRQDLMYYIKILWFKYALKFYGLISIIFWK